MLIRRAMSEAQYVSTGRIRKEEGLSHYGLGLGKYTHFTSPIRRYADIVVHRQLLLTLASRKVNEPIRPPPGFDRKVLDLLPESKTISIIRGEGIVDVAAEDEPTIVNADLPSGSSRIKQSKYVENNVQCDTIVVEGVTDIYNNQNNPS